MWFQMDKKLIQEIPDSNFSSTTLRILLVFFLLHLISQSHVESSFQHSISILRMDLKQNSILIFPKILFVQLQLNTFRDTYINVQSLDSLNYSTYGLLLFVQ